MLLVSLDNLGDLVFASALTPPLRERFPDATITLWCKEYTRDIGALIPYVDRIIAADPYWDRAPGRGRGSVLRFIATMAQVRGGRFDTALLAAAPWRTARAVAMSGVPVRVGLERRRNLRWLTVPLAGEDHTRPVLAEHARLLTPFGLDGARLCYRLEARRLAPRPDVERALAGRVVALHPFASKRERCVPVRVWLQVARGLEAAGYEPLWLGHTAELNEIRTSGGRQHWKYVDQFGGRLVDTAAALARAALFVGHDSGPLHVAGAFGVPVVGVFAPGEPERTFPQGAGPSRMIARPSPDLISAEDIVREALALGGARPA
jgi:ADP-heptose:LPS heptosyltransferase